MEIACQCPADGFCQRYQRDMAGRLREICRGENIATEKAAKYRANWDKIAAQQAASGRVGDELKALLASWSITATEDCQCEAHVKELNAWGIEACREHRETIVGWLVEEATKRGWAAQVAAKAASGWLVDESIRRAEVKIAAQTQLC